MSTGRVSSTARFSGGGPHVVTHPVGGTETQASDGAARRGVVRAGVLIWSQFTTWADLMRAGCLADDLGYDDIWSWDHLVALKGDPAGPIFEASMTLAGWAGVTRRARLGTMVAANTFRSPALLAKMVTALDHMTGGRAVLGLGAGWFEPEHTAFGLLSGRARASGSPGWTRRRRSSPRCSPANRRRPAGTITPRGTS